MFIKIDFEKVYERVKWLFIIAMLEALRFGPFFIKIIKTLFINVATCMSIHNTISGEIALFK